jgi:hypothetical protein
MISMYFGLADNVLEDLHAYFTEKYGRRMLDESLSVEKRHLGVLVNEESPAPGGPPPVDYISAVKKDGGLPSREDEQNAVRECVKEVLYRQLKKLALAIYLCMQKKRSWGTIGEEGIIVSFSRSILGISNSNSVTNFDIRRFLHILDKYDTELGNKSGDEIAGYCKDKKIDLFGREFSFPDLCNFIKLLDADYYLYSNSGPFCAEFIFGKAAWTKIADTPIYTFLDEYIRSPMHHLSIVGRSPSPIQIRRVSLETACFNKWKSLFDDSRIENRIPSRHPYNIIGKRIRKRAMLLYGIFTNGDFPEKKDALIADMVDGVIWHEFGHEISQADMDPVHFAIRGNIREEETIFSALEELLADWAPERGEKKGALVRFVELSNSNRNNAAALFYMFLSDNWYISDANEEYFSLRSKIYLSLGLYFLGDGGSVNFERMAREHDSIYAFFMEKFRRLIERFIDFIARGTFIKEGRQVGYEALDAEIFSRRRQNNEALTREAMKKEHGYWREIISCMKASEESSGQFRVFLDKESAALRQDVLELVSGGNAAVYDNSLWLYITARCGETGIYTPPAVIDNKKLVQRACEKAGLSWEKFKYVYKRFESVLNGRSLDVSTDYKTSGNTPNPFINVLQEMIFESNHRTIRSVVVNDKRDTGIRLEDNKELDEYIRDKLKIFRDQIRDGLYPYIELLRVNQRRAGEAFIEKIMRSLLFSGAGGLKNKIRGIKFQPLDPDVILEAVIPVRRGFMDWNTIRAVYRINNYMRSGDIMLWYTIDRDFMELLFEAYEFSFCGKGKYFPLNL